MSAQRYTPEVSSRLATRVTSSVNVALLDDHNRSRFDDLLRAIAIKVCNAHGIDFADMSAVTQVFMTHYRCTVCGVRPSYFLSLKSLKRVRCGICGYSVPFRNSGKYGRIRKEISITLNNLLRHPPAIRPTIISP